MLARGLILENIRGFDRDEAGLRLLEPPVFRAPPSTFNLSFTAPYGLSGNVPDLREFSRGAVEQHFPKTLDRIPGQDFEFPTDLQLDALEAFMLSVESRADGNFKLPRGNKNRPEVRGRSAFRAVGCGSCHGGTVLSGGNRVTGVEDLSINDGLPRDIGAGNALNPSFQTPGLFGLDKTAFFHNNAVGNAEVALPERTMQFTNLRLAVEFYESDEFRDAQGSRLIMTEDQKDDITAFLVAISGP